MGLRELDEALRPLIDSDSTRTRVVSRLATLMEVYDRLLVEITIDRPVKQADRRRDTRIIRKRFEQFFAAVMRTDPELRSELFSDGFVPPNFSEVLPQRQKGRRPDELRALVLDDVAFALKASGVAVTKTRNGTFDKVSRAVLKLLGDTQLPTDFFKSLKAAADRNGHRFIKSNDRTA
jgi:hypothetical protein